MKGYKETADILLDLLSINLDIEEKKKERKVAIRYNKTAPLRELDYDLPALALEIKELELEFNRKTREL